VGLSKARPENMSEIAAIIDTLESRIQKLIDKTGRLEDTIQELKANLEKSASVIHKQTDEISTLKSDYDALRTANALLGSEENKRDTKLKINSLIREIDYCIAQLAD
jgi:chromosome segregation ATPase